MTQIEVEPEARIDTVVRLAAGGEARRTEYAGVAWLDGKPIAEGMFLRQAPGAPKGIRVPIVASAFFVPDSLPYVRERLGEPDLSVSASLRATGEHGAITRFTAAFVDDPSGSPAWLHVQFEANAPWPFGISYRIVAVTPVDAVR